MHLTILSRSSAIYTTRRLVEAARARGHRARVLDPVQVEMGLGGTAPALYHRRAPFPRTDVVIPRIALSVNQYGLAVVNQLQLLGVTVLNSAQGISASRNKMRCLQLLAGRGIGVPLTVMASDASGLKDMVKHVGGLPVLVKLVAQSEKTGLMICESLPSLEAALEAILGLGQNIVVQQYVKGARGRDLRAFVVGGRVVAALRRRPRAGRFARTLARGARIEACRLPLEDARVAVETARVVGLEVCAVDMLEVKGGPLVFEVNSSPGLREAEEACGVDVAAAIVARAEELRAARPAPLGLARGRRGAAPRRAQLP
ncbi:ATP-grasp domain-containing protein [Anaeromyxobacter diazotrophicus]|uniref:Putative alpha-L-glutamate ligase n=1 Tax=Anaeromyxobacter diazotrophicus TaxID=2590199 RepID=A0A7I9VMP8_9BACT|nr:RimK family alpha-L-glutamate ligase [Anaeromyxobacter diazotrophicus]GEJ57267.1 putative alpha-L-glutamate ligase [Anaeromyxobacter diazotrophicus]